MTLRFVPPKLLAKYAVFIDHGDGRGHFKTYDTLGPAKAAYRMAEFYGRSPSFHDGKILEMVEGEWFTLYDVPKGTERPPWEKDKGYGYYSRYRSGWHTTPMSRDEYGEWRASVERERLAMAASRRGLSSVLSNPISINTNS